MIDIDNPPAHVQAVRDRLAQYLRGQQNVVSFLSCFTASVADIQTAFDQLGSARSLADSEGAQLDVIGDIVGQPREGRTDALYRLAIQARIKLNKSSGTVEDLYTIIGLLLTTGSMELIDFPPAGFVLRVTGEAFDEDTFALVARVFHQARAAGVNGQLQAPFAADANTFTLDGTPAQSLDAGLLAARSL